MISELNVRNFIHHEIIEKFLLGPQNGLEEVIKNDSPLNFYVTGILYPQDIDTGIGEMFSDNNTDTVTPAQNTNNYNASRGISGEEGNDLGDEILLSSDFKPSAIGLSTIVEASVRIKIVLQLGIYTKISDPDKQDEIANLKTKNPKITEEDLPVKYSIFKRSPIIREFVLEINEGDNMLLYDLEGKKLATKERNLYFDTDKKNNEPWIRLNINKRPLPSDSSKRIITVTLTNELVKEKKAQKAPQFCLFQPKIRLESLNGGFHTGEDHSDLENRTNEVKSLYLQYLKYASFATGHGCATSWENSEKSDLPITEWLKPKRYVQTEIIPSFEVAMSDVDFKDFSRFDGIMQVLDLRRLVPENYGGVCSEILFKELEAFINRYKTWIKQQGDGIERYLNDLGVRQDDKMFSILEDQARRNLNSCRDLFLRMENGLKILSDAKNPNALTAFRDANLSMYLQRAFSEYIKGKKAEKGAKLFTHISQGMRWTQEYNDPLPDVQEFINAGYEVKWRPFQLAFLLAQIEGAVNDQSKDRSTTDLIWFSTGGGKTEAYLGLISFTIFYRRLTYNSLSGGVTAIMRYTLRLLNKQQFARAVPLICACEMIRKGYEVNKGKGVLNIPDYGQERISIGIWVGSGLTPNKWEDEHGFWRNSPIQIADGSKGNGTEKYGLPLSECPCCGARLLVEENGRSKRGLWGIIANVAFPNQGKPRYNGNGWLICTNSSCHFGLDGMGPGYYLPRGNETRPQKDQRLRQLVEDAELNGFPIYFVDDTIYEKQPTLLFSTVDKYAFINWRSECYRLFNLEESQNGEGMEYTKRPPELIIQDEMHLITSSLGSIYGVFEMAVDELCTSRVNDKVIKPKIVTATATARNASNQCAMLYGRENFMQFPSPGIDADDSFYSRKKPVEYDLQGENYQAHGRLYLGLMASGFTNTVTQIRLISVLTQLIPSIETESEILDYYYNVLAYFNTLKELGKFRTLAQDDIPAYRKVLGEWTRTVYQDYEDERFIELSSQLSGDQISQNLDHLEKVSLPPFPTNISETQASVFIRLGVRKKSDIIKSDGTIKSSLPELLKARFTNEERISLYEDLTGTKWTDDPRDLVSEIIDRIKVLFSQPDNGAVCQITGATNMISVGVDIGRLNVMQVTGQPKMHAEYIQASSRVGRIKPGIVITTYNSAKNRDRSHYEKFTDYHRAFYKFVEATSVTPFSEPALEKALAGVVFAIMRKKYFGIGTDAQISPENSNTIQNHLSQTFDLLKTRIENVNGENRPVDNLKKVFDAIISDWAHLSTNNPVLLFPDFRTSITNNWDDKLYLSPEKRIELLNNNHDEIRKGIMMTLRNVEESTMVQVTKYN